MLNLTVHTSKLLVIIPWLVLVNTIIFELQLQRMNTAMASARELIVSNADMKAIPKSSLKKLALLVGINEYLSPTIQDLAGCLNDVEDMKNLLIGKFEFPVENILALTNEKATRDAIVKAFQDHLIAKAEADDIVIFYYGGHGSQMPDSSGDEIDGRDETIVPHDSRQGNIFDISDDEINGLLHRLSQKTQNITFIFDSCHSGTSTRAAGLARDIPADDRVPPPPPDYALSTRGVSEGENDLRPENLNYVLISGCTSGESSYEYTFDGKAHGTLTYFLTQELRKAGAAATYRDVMDNVIGQVNAVYPTQHPGLEGIAADRYAFSDSSSIAQPYILAAPLDSTTVTLSAGQIHGLTAGSIFDVYSPGTKRFSDTEKPIARAALTKVSAFTSEGKLVKGERILEASRAVERAHKYPDLKLLIHYKGLSESTTLQAIKAELEQYNYVESVPEALGYHLLLRQAGKEIVTEGGDPTEVSPRVPVGDPDAVKRVAEQATQWARWFNILSITNVAPVFQIKFTLNAVSEGQRRSPFQHVGQVVAVLNESEQFECTIENTTGLALYISILDLPSDGSICVIYPTTPGAAELLPPGASRTLTFEAYLPAGKEVVKDILKVFATTVPVDFHVLTQPPVRRGENRSLPEAMNDPLGQLLAHAIWGATRGKRPVPLGIWATAQRVVEVRREARSEQ